MTLRFRFYYIAYTREQKRLKSLYITRMFRYSFCVWFPYVAMTFVCKVFPKADAIFVPHLKLWIVTAPREFPALARGEWNANGRPFTPCEQIIAVISGATQLIFFSFFLSLLNVICRCGSRLRLGFYDAIEGKGDEGKEEVGRSSRVSVPITSTIRRSSKALRRDLAGGSLVIWNLHTLGGRLGGCIETIWATRNVDKHSAP